MKKITLKIITLAALLSCGGKAMASDFNLSGLDVADIKASQASVNVPAPKAASDDMIGMDMAVRIPFKTLKKAVALVAASEKRLTIIDQAAPVIFKSGEFLKISNIMVDANGITVVPTLTIKPYLEGPDRIALRIQRIQLHAAMEPSMKAAPMAAFNQEEIMAQVMDVMIKGVYAAVNEKLKVKQIPMKAEDVIKMKYDKAAWTLRATVSSKILGQFIPAGLVAPIHLTGFSFSDTGIAIRVQTAE